MRRLTPDRARDSLRSCSLGTEAPLGPGPTSSHAEFPGAGRDGPRCVPMTPCPLDLPILSLTRARVFVPLRGVEPEWKAVVLRAITLRPAQPN
jgi:hypothetical protein